MAYQITGKIEKIGDVVSHPLKDGEQTFNSREFVLDATRFSPETGEPWENHPRFELSGRNVNIIDGFQVGQRVTVDFVLRGSKYSDKQTGEIKYFTTVSAFRISAADRQQQTSQYSSQSQTTFQQPAQHGSNPFPQQVNNQGAPAEVQTYDLPF